MELILGTAKAADIETGAFAVICFKDDKPGDELAGGIVKELDDSG